VAGNRLESGRLQSLVGLDVVYHSLSIHVSIQLSPGSRPLDVSRFSPRRRPLRTLVSVVVFVLASGCASPQVVRGAVKPLVSQAEAETTLEGNVEVITEDSNQGSRTLYFLILGDRRIPLRFTAKPLNLTTGTRVRVRGRWEPDESLLVTTIERL
jgi:hypothetical protein